MQIWLIFLLLFCASTTASAEDHPWQITSAEGNSSITFGFLAQPQVERIRNDGGAGNSQDIFLRRFRLIASGNFTPKLKFFVDTDNPNLGKGTQTSGKLDDRIYLQDLVITYSFAREFQIDGGLLLVTYSHNSGQSAATLLPIDYGPYTFLSSDPTNSRAGRDYGIQARGYLFHDHFEYRAGVFQGSRTPSAANPGATNDFRYAARMVWYPFAAETGFFYTGTTLGTKKILSVGVGIDHQMRFNSHSVDLFYDQPIHHGDGITLQADYTHFDGDTTFPQLPNQQVWLTEAGYYNRRTKFGPFVQFANRFFTDPATPDLNRYLGGIAYWGSGHRMNIKLGIGRTLGSPSAASWQVALQGQAFIY